MRPTRRSFLGSVATTTLLAGCLGGDDPGGPDTTTSDPTTDAGSSPTSTTPATTGDATTAASETTDGSTSSATVGVRSHPEHGDVLVGPDGLSLYMFDQDTKGEEASTCSGSCAQTWPPLTVDGDPTRGDGVTAELTTFQRTDGATQVAAGGWPLYYYAPDEQPGDVSGQGVNDVWWLLAPDGTPIRPEPATTSTSTGSGSGY